MKVRAVQRDGYRLRVTSYGGGPPHAIVLPGLSADGRSLAPQIRLLRRTMGSVHVIDLPGFALPPALFVRDASFPSLARYVAAVADELGVDRATFVGHSLGGGVALHLALQRPELVDRLVLIAPAALGRSLHWIYKLYCIPLVGRALLRPQPNVSRPFLRRFLVGSRRRDDERFLDLLLRQGSTSRDRALSARAIVWANQPPWWRRMLLFLVPGGEQTAFSIATRLSALSGIPALVLWGSEDHVICVGDALRCRAALPSAQVHVARGAGHLLPLEDAPWVNARLAGFLQTGVVPEARAA